MFSQRLDPNQETIDHYEYIDQFRKSQYTSNAQSFSGIYAEIRDNMEERFGDAVIMSRFSPLNSSVFQFTVLFDKKYDYQNSPNEVKSITMILDDHKLGYFKGTGRNDYELSYHQILADKNIPLEVLHSERFSSLIRPSGPTTRIEAFKDGHIIPYFLNSSRRRFNKKREYWGRVDELQKARKKYCYLKKKDVPENQTVFMCDQKGEFDGTIITRDQVQTTLDEKNAFVTPKFIKRPRNKHTRSIRNDIVYKTERGLLISEVKPSAEISPKKVKLLYKQLMAYDAEQKFYNDYDTPIVVTLPVNPPVRQIKMFEKVKKDTGRDIGVMCIAEYNRYLRETAKGMANLDQRIKKNKNTAEEFGKEFSLLEDYYMQFVV